MTRQFPLAVAQLFIKHTPPFRATTNSDTMTLTPTLHMHTDTRLTLGNQRNPVLILVHIPRGTSRAFAVLWLPLDARLFERGLRRAVPRWAAPRTSDRSQQAGFRVVGSGSCVRARVGRGRRHRALIIQVNVVEPIGRRPAQLDGDQHGRGTAEDAQGDLGARLAESSIDCSTGARVPRRQGCRGL